MVAPCIPTGARPAAVSRGINEEQPKEIEALGRDAIEFAKFSLKAFEDIVLKNTDYVSPITGGVYTHQTYNMGTVDANNRLKSYAGKTRIVGLFDGKEFVKYDPRTTASTLPNALSPGPT